MTSLEMINALRAQGIRVCGIEVDYSVSPLDLYQVLTECPTVREIKTPDQRAWRDEAGSIIVVRNGAIAYSDGI